MDDVTRKAGLTKHRMMRIGDNVGRLAHRRRDLQSRRDWSRVVAGERVVETLRGGVGGDGGTAARIAMAVGSGKGHGRRQRVPARPDLVMNRRARRVARRGAPLRAHYGRDRRACQNQQERQACERTERTDHEPSIAFRTGVQGCKALTHSAPRRRPRETMGRPAVRYAWRCRSSLQAPLLQDR